MCEYVWEWGVIWDAGLSDVRDMHGDGWDVCEFREHEGVSTCDGLGTFEACVNTCGSGEFWDAGLTTCVTCTVTDGTCASSAEHGGFVSTCDGLGTSEATCVNTCGSGEFWDAGRRRA